MRNTPRVSVSQLPEFDYMATWNAARRCFDSEQCPPALRFWALTELGAVSDVIPFPVQEIREQAALRSLCDRQRGDGSFGEKDAPAGRILPSLWALRSLTDLGATADLEAWASCADFLHENAVHEGGFAFDGRRDGVLSCYTGIFASLLLRGADRRVCSPGATREKFRADAHACLDWLEAYQSVRYRERDFRDSRAAEWGSYLERRFGGCFAATSCLSGVVRAGEALLLGERLALLPAIREYLLERHVYQRRDGGVIPLWSKRAVDEARAAAWLSSSFPLYYHVDLLEALHVVTASGGYDPRLTDAVLLVCGKRLADGTWSLEHKTRNEFMYAPDRVSRKRGSRWATFRRVSG